VRADFLTDVLVAARALATRPGVALTVIVVLALGTAVNAAVFAAVHAAIFSGFAQVERNDRIVARVLRCNRSRSSRNSGAAPL